MTPLQTSIPRFAPRCLARLIAALAVGLISTGLAHAQAEATGSIQGRVFHVTKGNQEYLEKARLSIEGTRLEAFTDQDGWYRFSNVPEGTVQIRTFFTGFGLQTDTVTIAAGQTLQHDVGLDHQGKTADKDDKAVVLGAYHVKEGQLSPGAYALNEQRFAPNIKNVISSDQFGPAAADDVGEIMKFMPGVAMDYAAGDPRFVSLGGAPYNYVPITVNGFGFTNAQQNSMVRGSALEQLSLATISRVEKIDSPTPESPGNALAGSINFVGKSAFERSKSEFTVNTFITFRDDYMDFKKTPGPRSNATRKVLPGFDFSYTAPVNSRFGYTVSGGASKRYSNRDFIVNGWVGINVASNGTTLPDPTPDKPYFRDLNSRDGLLLADTSALSATFDFKLSPNDKLSFSATRNVRNTEYDNRLIIINAGAVNPGDFSPHFTHGRVGAGSLTVNQEHRNRDSMTIMSTLLYTHNGPIWKAAAGIGYSKARDYTQAPDKGFMGTVQLLRTNVTVNFDDFDFYRPRRITVFDGTTGAPIDPFDINNYVVRSATHTVLKTIDGKRSAFANLARDFDMFGVPTRFKIGFDLSESWRSVTLFPHNIDDSATFLGADGRSSTTPVGNDDSATPFYWSSIAGRHGAFGLPAVPAADPFALFQHYLANPSQWQRNTPAAQVARIVNAGQNAKELISAAYIRGDASFFNRRLKLVGGIRGEQTNVDGYGPLNDPTRNFQRDANGNVLKDNAGNPRLISTDPLVQAMLTRVWKGAHAKKEYLRLFPSLNASFNVIDNFIARAAYSTAVGRPAFSQYTAGLTLPNTELPPSATNRISVNNPGIKAWSADSKMVKLEYYFTGGGVFEITGVRRDYENFFGSRAQPVTPEFLAAYHLDPAIYESYDVATNYNITDTVRSDILTVAYSQPLKFLPEWARGVSVFANGTRMRFKVLGPLATTVDNFAYSPRFGSAGVRLDRQKYRLIISGNYKGPQDSTRISGRGIEPGTRNYKSSATFLDISAEYRFLKRYTAYVKVNNLNDQGTDMEMYGPNTPAHAQFRQSERFGATWTIGLEGKF